MLSFCDDSIGRRPFLRIGSLALGGLSLAAWLGARAAAGNSASGGAGVTQDALRDKSVVLLFLHGGPSQTETFDPKMDAPSGVRSVTGEVRTTIPGVTFGATLEKLAQRADRLAIVRSFQTGDGNHDIKPVVSRFSAGSNLGSVVARIAGANDPTTGMPRNVALFPRAVDPGAQPAQRAFGNFESTGQIGAGFAPFVPGAGGDLQRDMQIQVERGRLEDRRGLLLRLDRLRRGLERTGALGGLGRLEEQAFETILGGVEGAFDLSREDPRVIERYDTEPLVRPHQIGAQWNNFKYYVDNARTLGKLMLLARRLCEAGCRFVTVTTNFVWDMHADENNATVEEGMRYCGVPFDHAVSAFLDDVEARGLSERILLVACGEMGRTPRLNARGGRDHWGRLAPLLLAGGGWKMGQVIGRSDRLAGEPASDPVTLADLVSTIFHTVFDVGALRTVRGLPPEIARLIESGAPPAELA